MHEVNLDGAELKIFRDCVDKFWIGNKTEKMNKVQCLGIEVMRSLYCLFDYPRGTVSVSSLDYFLSVGSSSEPSHTSFTVSVGVRHIQEYLKKKRGRKQKFINPQQEKARHEERMNQGKVILRANLVVGYWKLIPM